MNLNVGHGLRRLSEWAARVPSGAFGLGYLTAIPLFALVYAVMPSAFYHPTVRYEPMVQAQAQVIASRLKENYISQPGISGRASSGGLWPIFIVQPEPGRVEVLVHLWVTDPKDKHDLFLVVALEVEPDPMLQPADTSDPTGERPGEEDLYYITVKPRVVTGRDVETSALFPCGSYQDKACLPMTNRDLSELWALSHASGGQITGEAQGSFSRMLYFSAVTITTLGYGDIVPLTVRTRAIVTVEIILGPLLFGLFLNSLIGERSRRNSTARRNNSPAEAQIASDDTQ